MKQKTSEILLIGASTQFGNDLQVRDWAKTLGGLIYYSNDTLEGGQEYSLWLIKDLQDNQYGLFNYKTNHGDYELQISISEVQGQAFVKTQKQKWYEIWKKRSGALFLIESKTTTFNQLFHGLLFDIIQSTNNHLALQCHLILATDNTVYIYR
jgi:hypothetical protein